MTRAWFDRQMARLAGLRFVPADLTTHWEALHDLPEAVLEAAVTRAQRTRSDFPAPSELREDADRVAHYAQPVPPEADRAQPLAQPFTVTVPEVGIVVSITREWKYFCPTCSDSGWETVWCGEPGPTMKPWSRQMTCERRQDHAPHEWMWRCVCADTNPALVRKRENQRRYAERSGRTR